MGLLYGTKKLLTEWQFPVKSLEVSEGVFVLTWNDELVVFLFFCFFFVYKRCQAVFRQEYPKPYQTNSSTSIVNGSLHVQFGPTWQEYPSEERLAKANQNLRFQSRRKTID